jgi:hypothetical protein
MNSKGFCSSSSRDRRVRLLGILLGLSALVLLFCASCVSVGREFPVSEVSEIRIGETTRNEIRAMFGSPWRVGLDDGQPTWTYGRYRYRLFRQTSTQDLVVRFNEQAVVASYTFNTTAHTE